MSFSNLSKRATLGSNTYTDRQIITGASFGAGSPNLTLTGMTSQNQYSRPAMAFICDDQSTYGVIWMDIDGTLKYNIGDGVYAFTLNRLV